MAPSIGRGLHARAVCNVDFSVAGGGVHEVKHHCSSAKHKSFLDGVLAQPCFTSVLQKINHIVICPKKACAWLTIYP